MLETLLYIIAAIGVAAAALLVPINMYAEKLEQLEDER